MVVTLLLDQQKKIGEKPTVVLYTYIIIDRHAGTPGKTNYYGLGGANPAVNTPRPSRGVCVCFFPSILDIKFVERTSRGHTGGRSHRIFNPPSFCSACLDFCREKDSAIPFPRRP